MKVIYILLTPFLLFGCTTTGMENKKDSLETSIQPKVEHAAVIVSDSTMGYDTYCNGRFGYCIDYPTAFINKQPESANGDGCIFKDKTGEEVLRVYGSNNLDADGNTITLDHQFLVDVKRYENDTDNTRITYKKLAKLFFILSGIKKGKIFYQKTILKDDAFAYAVLQYPEKEKTIYAEIINKTFSSFK